MKDLTNSAIDRQNIINNSKAIEKIQGFIGLTGLLYENEYLFTSKMSTSETKMIKTGRQK